MAKDSWLLPTLPSSACAYLSVPPHDSRSCLHVLNDFLSRSVVLGSFLSVSAPMPSAFCEVTGRTHLGSACFSAAFTWAKSPTCLIWGHLNQLLDPPHHPRTPHPQKVLLSESHVGSAPCLLITNTAVVFCRARTTRRERRAAPLVLGCAPRARCVPAVFPFGIGTETAGMSALRASACPHVC